MKSYAYVLLRRQPNNRLVMCWWIGAFSGAIWSFSDRYLLIGIRLQKVRNQYERDMPHRVADVRLGVRKTPFTGCLYFD